MPYKSEQQRKFFHTDTAKKAGITNSIVNEFDQASKGLSLPEAINKKKKEDSMKKAFHGGKIEASK